MALETANGLGHILIALILTFVAWGTALHICPWGMEAAILIPAAGMTFISVLFRETAKGTSQKKLRDALNTNPWFWHMTHIVTWFLAGRIEPHNYWKLAVYGVGWELIESIPSLGSGSFNAEWLGLISNFVGYYLGSAFRS
jgi:hypothetical protein